MKTMRVLQSIRALTSLLVDMRWDTDFFITKINELSGIVHATHFHHLCSYSGEGAISTDDEIKLTFKKEMIRRGGELTRARFIKRDERVTVIDTEIGVEGSSVEKNEIESVATDAPDAFILGESEAEKETRVEVMR
jgi:hypothetical protein